MLITDQQYQRLMKTYNDSGVLGHAAMKAGMDPKTARRYIRAGKGPQEMKRVHDWRTRVDPVAAIWPAAEQWLETTPELEAKMLFEYLLTDPTAPVVGVDGGALRTFQRRVTQWRRLYGPAKEVCFAQVREPGHSLQFDWTHAAELWITLAGVAYPHRRRQPEHRVAVGAERWYSAGRGERRGRILGTIIPTLWRKAGA